MSRPRLYVSANLIISVLVSGLSVAHAQEAFLARGAKPLSSAEESALKPKDSFKECDVCPEMLVVPDGSFIMGSPESEEGRSANEGPQRKVTISRPFAMGKFEVTFAEWHACAEAGGCKYRPFPAYASWPHTKDPARHPVIGVPWDVITKEYLPWLSLKTGKSYRLPTEAEWEYAARAGTTTPFSTGQTITTDQARFEAEPLPYPHPVPPSPFRFFTAPVGSFEPNAFGLHDMHGNVGEWVQDCYRYPIGSRYFTDAASYTGAPVDGSAVTCGFFASFGLTYRVLRGGAWPDKQEHVRSAIRISFIPEARRDTVGFRVAGTLTP